MTRENATDAGRQQPESWVTADKFENDCAPLDRQTGVTLPQWLEEMIEKARRNRADKAT